MIRIVFAVAAVLTICLPVQPSSAANVTYLSAEATSAGGPCNAANPCPNFISAIAQLLPGGGRILCLDPVGDTVAESITSSLANLTFDIDCPAGSWGAAAGAVVLNNGGINLTMTFRNMAFNGVGGATSAIKITGSGTLVFENCVFANFAGIALDIEPTGPFNLVIKNSRISNNTGVGVLIKPAVGGSVTATFDGATITKNGGGLKTDTTNGAVKVDISNSTISYNANNGLVAIGGTGGQALVNLSHDVVASNGQAGIEAIGANSAVLVDTTLLDENQNGATASVSGGILVTYGNNRIVGGNGSGFAATVAPLQ